MGSTAVAVFSTPWASKFQRLRPLIADMVALGYEVHVFTGGQFEPEIVRAGARFVDVYGTYPVDAADDVSLPMPCRHVTYAAVYAEAIAADVRALDARLIVHDSFAVIAQVVATMLDLPRVAFRAGHYVAPAEALQRYETDRMLVVSPACERAVATLRDRYGLADASALSYMTTQSPQLNLYGEPAEWLSPEQRAALEPLAFYGSLPPLAEIQARRRSGPTCFPDATDGELKVYAAFGAFVWGYWPEAVFDAFAAVAEAVAGMPGARAVLGLGDAQLGADAMRKLTRPNVEVAARADQWRALADADVFITHHGLYSTHEAVLSRVPMLGYPFFGDQPALTSLAAGLGLSVPLVDAPRAPLTAAVVRAGLEDVVRRAGTMRVRLAEAREWELRTLRDRPAIAAQVAGLAA